MHGHSVIYHMNAMTDIYLEDKIPEYIDIARNLICMFVWIIKYFLDFGLSGVYWFVAPYFLIF